MDLMNYYGQKDNMKETIKITGLMLRNEGQHVIVEVEIDGKWYPVIKEYSGFVESAISHIIEPAGIRTVIERGFPFP